ncbi:jun-like transcription factor [Malassezia cuniculi]|uniref:Jun-like transcription factor n=1 Tax=Malassezia cuniculi TaxID=948313 RepID=A0AAF0EV22_9BASI|nr:jun-like transcription factor [Malassezia cuniculi]
MGKKDKTEGVTISPEVVAFVHAFVHVHGSSKLAEKLASRFPKLGLEDNIANAESLSNALVETVKTAIAVPGSAASAALGTKKSKKDKKRKRDAEATEEAEEPVAEEAVAEEPVAEEPVAEEPVEAVTEEPVTETPAAEQVGEDADVSVADVSLSDESRGKNKKRKDSGIGNRFQRVKSDQAVFLDDRLRDMSYAAKSGAGDWGAKANEDLIKTRGKSFTKEKNKKKRGSYKGGLIDQGSHSIKFTYDDE